jgi:proteasome lid subunit RPN8/RPN11
LHLRDLGPTEVGGFGITRRNDLLMVEDIRLVHQECTSVTVRFHDEAVADLFDEQVDLGHAPEQFARIWVHTHPGNSAQPSRVDEETFATAFGHCSWAVMFILAVGGRAYARLKLNAGPCGSMRIPVRVDYSASFPAADPAAWQDEYAQCVTQDDIGLAWFEDDWDAGFRAVVPDPSIDGAKSESLTTQHPSETRP